MMLKKMLPLPVRPLVCLISPPLAVLHPIIVFFGVAPIRLGLNADMPYSALIV